MSEERKKVQPPPVPRSSNYLATETASPVSPAPTPPPPPPFRARTGDSTASPAPSLPPPPPPPGSRKEGAPKRAAPRSRPRPIAAKQDHREEFDPTIPLTEISEELEPDIPTVDQRPHAGDHEATDKVTTVSRHELEIIVEEGGVLTALRGFFEEELESIPEEDRRQGAILLYELGHLEELVLRDQASALAHYEAAFARDPSLVSPQKALRRIYAMAGRWEDSLRVLKQEIENTPSPEMRASLLTQMGEIFHRRLEDTEEAIRVLKAAHQLAPHSRRAVELLRGIYTRSERWSELLETLRALANIVKEPQERARLLMEMAEIAEHHLQQASEAEDLYSQALSLDPRNEAVAVALRRLYYAHQRYKELSDLLAREAGRADEPEERFADLYRAARLAELHLHDDDRAASLLETAAALRPTDLLPLQVLCGIYQRTGRYSDLATVLGRQLRLVREPLERASLCYQLGRVFEDWLDDPAEAQKAYREALKEQPGHEAAMRGLIILGQRYENWPELFDLVLLRAERMKDIARRADGYLQAAEISETYLDDLRRAVDLYERAYQLQGGSPKAFCALHRIYRQSQQWEPLADLYERQAERCQDTALAVSYLRAAARIYEEMISAQDKAIAVLEQLEQRSPDDREALIDLARLYEEVGRLEDLCRVLVRWAEQTEDEREQIDLRRRVAELMEGPLRKPEQAIDLYREILKSDPSDRPTLERLKTLFERSGQWTDLVNTLRAELSITPSSSEQAPLLAQIGQLCRDKLGQTAEAQQAFEEALLVDSNYTPALTALQELLHRESHWSSLVELMSTKAEHVRDPARASVHLFAAAELCEEYLKEADRAEQYYTRALEQDPASSPAKQGLERIYLAALNRPALEAHYLREAEETSNPVTRLRAYLRLGELFNGPLEDAAGAAAAYESALQVVNDQPDALFALAALLRRTHDWDRLSSLLARIAGTSRDRDTALAALNEWASIVQHYLADKWDPAPILERVLEGNPGDAAAIFALECLAFERSEGEAIVSLALRQVKAGADAEWGVTLCHRAALLLFSWGRRKEAAEILRAGLKMVPDYLPTIRLLRRIDEQTGEWSEAAELLLSEGDLVTKREVAHAALIRAGNIYLERFGNEAVARRAFERVFNEDAGNRAAFEQLRSILEAAEEWHTLVEHFHRRMAALELPERLPLQTALSAIYQEKLGDINGAVEVLEEMLAINPLDTETLLQSATLCELLKRWRDAEGYWARLSTDVQIEPDVRRQALLKRSIILEDQLGEETEALVVLQQLLDEFPGDREALQRCIIYYQHQGNWEKTVEVLESLARSGAPAERINHLVNLAEIFSRTMQEPERASRALQRAAGLCVENAAGIERFSEYFERRGDYEGLASFLGEALAQLPPEGAPGSVAVRLARARILAGRLLRPNEAEIEIRRALQNDPSSMPARLELAGLHLWGDNLGEAISEYMNVLDLDPFSVEAFRGLYRVYDRKGDMERAAGAAQAVCAVAESEVPERTIAEQATVPMESMLASAMATPLGVEDFWHLLAHPDEPRVANELLYLCADFIPQLFPDEVERVMGGNIIPLSEEDTLTLRCTQLAQVLGIDRFECCIGHHLSSVATATPGVPPRLVVDDTFANQASPASFRFAIGRALAGILTRSLYLAVLPPRAIEVLLAAIVEIFERGFSGYLAQGRDVEELSRTVNRAIPRRLRKLLEEPARSYAAGQPVAAAAWYVASQRSAERAGLLLAGDVEAALAVLQEEQASRSVRADLLRFAVGPHLYEARRRLGLGI